MPVLRQEGERRGRGDPCLLSLDIRSIASTIIFSQRNGTLYSFETGRSRRISGTFHRSCQLQWLGNHTANGLGKHNDIPPKTLLLIIYKDNYNAFGCEVSESLLLGAAKKIVDLGLRDLGYRYVVLDDCWSAGRSSNGTLQVNTTKFPNGMAHVADELHGMGLLFGMYSSAGVLTCAQYGMHA